MGERQPARGISLPPRRSEGARSSPAGGEARPVRHVAGCRAGVDPVAPDGWSPAHGGRGTLDQAPPAGRLRARLYAAHRALASVGDERTSEDRKSTRLNSSHQLISYAVFCLKKKKKKAK